MAVRLCGQAVVAVVMAVVMNAARAGEAGCCRVVWLEGAQCGARWAGGATAMGWWCGREAMAG